MESAEIPQKVVVGKRIWCRIPVGVSIERFNEEKVKENDFCICHGCVEVWILPNIPSDAAST